MSTGSETERTNQVFQLFAADEAAASESADEPSALDRIKGWLAKGAEKAGPAVKKAASLTLAGAKKLGAASVTVSKKVVDGARDQINKRRGAEPSAGDEPAADEPVADEKAADA